MYKLVNLESEEKPTPTPKPLKPDTRKTVMKKKLQASKEKTPPIPKGY